MMTNGPPSSKFPRFFLFGSFLILAVVAVYSQTLHGPFLFDDQSNIVNNTFLKIEELNRDTIAYVLKAPHPSARRKLANLTFAINYLWCGLETHCYHLVNIGIHAISGILAFGFFYQLLGVGWIGCKYGPRRFRMAWVAAMLWVLHPINLNAVTYIVQRMTSMAGMFGLFSLNCWLLSRKSAIARMTPQSVAWGSAGFLFWLAGIFSKENLILLPLMILSTEFILFRRDKIRVPRRILLVFVAMTSACIFIGLWRFWEFFDLYDIRNFTPVERLLTQSRVLWHYVSLFLYPVTDRFSLLYDFPISRGWLRPPTTLLAVLGWFLVSVFAWINRKKYPVLLWVFAWFFCGHLLESTILPLEIIYEHRNYLPSLAFSLGMVFCGVLLADRVSLGSQTQMAVCCAFLLIVGSATYTRNLDFEDAQTFYARELEKFPESRRLRLNLAIAYNRMGQYDDGFPLLRELAEEYPRDVTILQNLFVFFAEIAANEERSNEILTRILALIEDGYYTAGDDSVAVNNLARYFYNKGDFSTAIVLTDKLIENHSNIDSLWVFKGNCHAQMNEWKAARNAFKKALSLKPDDYAIFFLYGRSLIHTGAVEDGCRQLRRASLDPVHRDTAEKSKKLFSEVCDEIVSSR
jgi:tetratricopeptide (TPR) repeat protein